MSLPGSVNRTLLIGFGLTVVTALPLIVAPSRSGTSQTENSSETVTVTLGEAVEFPVADAESAPLFKLEAEPAPAADLLGPVKEEMSADPIPDRAEVEATPISQQASCPEPEPPAPVQPVFDPSGLESSIERLLEKVDLLEGRLLHDNRYAPDFAALMESQHGISRQIHDLDHWLRSVHTPDSEEETGLFQDSISMPESPFSTDQHDRGRPEVVRKPITLEGVEYGSSSNALKVPRIIPGWKSR